MRINRTTIGGILIGASVIIGVVILWPMYQEFMVLQQNIESKRAILDEKESYIDKLVILERELKNYSAEVEKIDAAIPETRGIPALFHFIQGMTSTSGLVLRSIGASEIKDAFPNSDIVVTLVSIQTNGSYAALKEFLKQARVSAEMVEITSLSFGEPGTDTGEFNYTISLQIYSY
ncbi:type 4a pilus biogenesis protein PilO [Patescibacteria group bacterium]|nr:type 4a pilus biogenesis protein PilO [Patescibacteria group bacterium]